MTNLTRALCAVAVIGGTACTDDNAVPDDVLELRMQATIPAGTELEYCQFVKIPDTWVTRDHIEFTAGSHHVLENAGTLAQLERAARRVFKELQRRAGATR